MDEILIDEIKTVQEGLLEYRKILRRILTKTDIRHEIPSNARLLFNMLDGELENCITALSLVIGALRTKSALSDIQDLERQGSMMQTQEEEEEEYFRLF